MNRLKPIHQVIREQKTAVGVLQELRRVWRDRRRWAHGFAYSNADGSECNTGDVFAEAVGCCLVVGVRLAAPNEDVRFEAGRLILGAKGLGLIHINDNRHMRHRKMLARLNAAINRGKRKAA